mgnify:FL=1
MENIFHILYYAIYSLVQHLYVNHCMFTFLSLQSNSIIMVHTLTQLLLRINPIITTTLNLVMVIHCAVTPTECIQI